MAASSPACAGGIAAAKSEQATQSSSTDVVEPKHAACIFCKLSRKENPGQEYFYEDDLLFVIPDITPHAPYHLLVITREHVKNASRLTAENADLLKAMVDAGTKALRQRANLPQDSDIKKEDLRIGFHWPPINSIDHLHMHVMYPVNQMSWTARNIVFNPKLSFVFKTVDDVLNRIGAGSR